MAILLDAQQLTAAFGARPLFDGVSFTVDETGAHRPHRPERRGQVDAAAHPGRDRVAPTAARSRGGAACASRSWSRCRGSRPAPRCATRSRRGSAPRTTAATRTSRSAQVFATLALDGRGRRRRARHAGRVAVGRLEEARRARRAPSPAGPTCCCSTSRPTTWTSRASSGSRSCCRAAAPRSRRSRSPTIACSCSGSRRASSSSTAATPGGLLSVAGDYADLPAREGRDDARAGAARGGPAQHPAPRDRVAAARRRRAHDQAAGAHRSAPARSATRSTELGRRNQTARPRRWTSRPPRRRPRRLIEARGDRARATTGATIFAGVDLLPRARACASACSARTAAASRR